MKFNQLKIRYSPERDLIMLVWDSPNGNAIAVDVTDQVLNSAMLFARKMESPRKPNLLERILRKLGMRVVHARFVRHVPGTENGTVRLITEYSK